MGCPTVSRSSDKNSYSQGTFTIYATTSHVTISATNSTALDAALADIDLIKTTVTTGGAFLYDPATQQKTVTLVKADSVDAVFKISTTTVNAYSGPITYRLIVSDVRKNNASITSNITINPSAGLNTNVATPINKILQVTP